MKCYRRGSPMLKNRPLFSTFTSPGHNFPTITENLTSTPWGGGISSLFPPSRPGHWCWCMWTHVCVLENVEYGCRRIYVDGRWTDTIWPWQWWGQWNTSPLKIYLFVVFFSISRNQKISNFLFHSNFLLLFSSLSAPELDENSNRALHWFCKKSELNIF